MKKIGIFYGSTLGHTKKLAERIQYAFGEDQADVLNIKDSTKKDIEKYDNLIFGTSTWGVGEMQEDWENFLGQLEKTDLSGKKIALFGIGDQKEWADRPFGKKSTTYRLAKKAQLVGSTPIDDYFFEISLAVKNNQFVGLAIDNHNQAELTLPRINNWVEQLQLEFK